MNYGWTSGGTPCGSEWSSCSSRSLSSPARRPRAGFESANLATIFNWQSRVAAISPNVTVPIFQGGRLRANLAATKARYEQAVAAYVNQVLIAYGDVEDALTDLHTLSDEVESLRAAVSASRDYLRLSQVEFQQGLVDYLVVVDAERTLLANQLSLAQAVNLQMGASIALIKALGGGWNGSEDGPSRPAETPEQDLGAHGKLLRPKDSRATTLPARAAPEREGGPEAVLAAKRSNAWTVPRREPARLGRLVPDSCFALCEGIVCEEAPEAELTVAS